jgi:hypothetical protein
MAYADKSHLGRTRRLKQKAVASFYNENPITVTKNIDPSTFLLFKGGNASIYNYLNTGPTVYDPGCGSCENVNPLTDYNVSPGQPFGIGGHGYAVVYANGLWATGGYNTNGNNILYTIDPAQGWTASPGRTFGVGGFVKGVSYGNGLWVAVGSDISGNYSNILYSTDPTKGWEASPGGTFISSAGGSGIAYGNGYWVAVGSDGTGYNIYYSINPRLGWTNSDFAFDYKGNGVTYANNLWVACGQDTTGNTILYATDPTGVWTPSPGRPFGAFIGGVGALASNITFANGLWVAVGLGYEFNLNTYTGNNILYSKDPTVGWSASPGTPFGINGYGTGVAGDTNWVAVGNNSTQSGYNLLYTADPTKGWNRQFTATTRLSNVTTDKQGNWVAVGQDNTGGNNIVYFKIINQIVPKF